MGKDGALLVTNNQAIKGEAMPVTVVSTVGAGDSMLAGFVYGLEQGMELQAVLAFALTCSMLTIGVEGYPKLELSKVMKVSKKAKVYNI